MINSGNGAAGPTLDAINKKLKEKGVKTNFVFVHHDPDPTFPNGIPNPLLEENRSSTANAVIKEKADFGVAFDGDFDRCFSLIILATLFLGVCGGSSRRNFLKQKKRGRRSSTTLA